MQLSKLGTVGKYVKRLILLFLIIDAVFLLATHLTFFLEYIIETTLIGIPIWLGFGFISPKVLTILLSLSRNLRRNACLIEPKVLLEESGRLEKFFIALDSTVTPTLFLFGILNVIVNHFMFILGYGMLLFMVLTTFVTGVIFSPMYVLRDSGLLIIDIDKRAIEPLGRASNNYLRGISGISAFLGFLYTVFIQSFDVYATLMVLMAVVTIIYPPIVVILVIYMHKHSSFVRKLNILLGEKFPKCRITIELDVEGEGKIVIKQGNQS